MKILRGAIAALLVIATAGSAAAMWGETGHQIVGATAAAHLPAAMPAFFREAGPQLRYLNPEPDRWRDDEATAMDEAFRYDHYIDLENVPGISLVQPDRYEYLESLYEAGLAEPERDAGFLPFRILEMQQRLTGGFARWRSATSPDERSWIEQRIVNDAGILGHYVADAAQPHHTTIHYNGWAEGAPNPGGYTTERDFHWRFESRYVDEHVSAGAVAAAVPDDVQPVDDVREAVLAYIQESHDQVERLYQIEKAGGFDEDRTTPEAEAFTVRRLAAAATMLRSLWYTAWLRSGIDIDNR